MESKIYEKLHAHKDIYKIDEVYKRKDCFEILYEHLTCWLDEKYGIEPKVGDEITVYTYQGCMIRGIDINNREAYFKTQAQLDKEHEEFCKKFKEDQWKEWRKTMERIKDDTPYETIDISGMSGSYEWGCQIMLQAGLKFLHIAPTIDGKMSSFLDTLTNEPHRDFHFDYQQNPHIIGIAWSDAPWCKELDKVITEAPEKFGKQYGCTGAQHQAVINHLEYIYKHGYDKWLEAFKDRKYTYPKGLPPPKD